MAAIKTVDASALAEIMSAYVTVKAFLGWLEDESGVYLKDKYGDLIEDYDDLARRYAADTEAERAALDQILRGCK